MALSDWTVVRGSYTIGTDGPPRVGLLTMPNVWDVVVTTHNTTFQTKDGGHAGLDTRGPLLLEWQWLIAQAGSPDAVMDSMASARTAYAPTSTNVTLTITAPGSRSLVYTGRPQGVQFDTAELASAGKVICRASFWVPSGVPTSGSL